MMKRSKRPFSWVLEEYAFGAVALKEEINRHKKEDENHWSIKKAVCIRLLYVYAVIGTFVLAVIGLILQGIQKLKH